MDKRAYSHWIAVPLMLASYPFIAIGMVVRLVWDGLEIGWYVGKHINGRMEATSDEWAKRRSHSAPEQR